jgi:hypothetical protein
MSEPTIKPVGRICLECKASEADDHWYKCSHHMSPDDLDNGRVNVYTHDDLVAVAREAYVQCGFERECEAGSVEIVEQLTGVKR